MYVLTIYFWEWGSKFWEEKSNKWRTMSEPSVLYPVLCCPCITIVIVIVLFLLYLHIVHVIMDTKFFIYGFFNYDHDYICYFSNIYLKHVIKALQMLHNKTVFSYLSIINAIHGYLDKSMWHALSGTARCLLISTDSKKSYTHIYICYWRLTSGWSENQKYL